jgi:hypothetical protein
MNLLSSGPGIAACHLNQSMASPTTNPVIMLVGISTNGLHMGYSYDYTVSKLGIGTGGAHEVSVRYEFFLGDPRKPAKNVRKLPCPRF